MRKAIQVEKVRYSKRIEKHSVRVEYSADEGSSGKQAEKVY